MENKVKVDSSLENTEFPVVAVAEPVRPTLSRDVHYVAGSGTHYAAKVVAVNPESPMAVNLFVMGMPKQNISGIGENYIYSVPFDATGKEIGTWHYPERAGV